MTQLYRNILQWIQFTEKSEASELLIIKIYHSQYELSYTINPYFESLKRQYPQKHIKFQVWDSENEQLNAGTANPRLKKLLQKFGNPGDILLIDAQQIYLIDKLSPDMLFSEMNQRVLEYV